MGVDSHLENSKTAARHGQSMQGNSDKASFVVHRINGVLAILMMIKFSMRVVLLKQEISFFSRRVHGSAHKQYIRSLPIFEFEMPNLKDDHVLMSVVVVAVGPPVTTHI